MEYKANYSRRYYVESTAYDFDMFTEKSKRKSNIVDFEKAKKNTSTRSKQSSKSVKAHKVNMRLVSTFMVCLLFLGMFGMSIYLRGEINEISAVELIEDGVTNLSKYGLDKPVFQQYLTYLKDIATKFDFGPSIKQRGRDVMDIIIDGMKTSAKLGLAAAGIALISGTVLGSVAALRRNKFIDRVIMVITTAFVSMPSFIMGTFMLLLFTVKFTLFPANGAEAGGLVLPIITLSLSPMANITRLTRSSMLDVLGQDYIRTAKDKGVSAPKIIFGHALKNALIPVITYFGPMLAYIVTGSLVVEQIFAVPGIGRSFVSSIINRDYTLIMGTTIVLAILIVIMNLVSDILYKVIDPRITLE